AARSLDTDASVNRWTANGARHLLQMKPIHTSAFFSDHRFEPHARHHHESKCVYVVTPSSGRESSTSLPDHMKGNGVRLDPDLPRTWLATPFSNRIYRRQRLDRAQPHRRRCVSGEHCLSRALTRPPADAVELRALQASPRRVRGVDDSSMDA